MQDMVGVEGSSGTLTKTTNDLKPPETTLKLTETNHITVFFT